MPGTVGIGCSTASGPECSIESDPTACLTVAYTGTWFDTGKAAEAGRKLIEAGGRDESPRDEAHRFEYVFEDYGSWSNLVMDGSSLARWGDLGDRFGDEQKSRIEARRREILAGTYRVPIIELPVPECDAR